MTSRREFLQVAGATAALLALSRGARGQSLAGTVTEADLLRFDDLPGAQLTLLHMTDCHAQLRPIYFREPSTNLGVGDAAGLAPHITDMALLKHFGIDPDSYHAYALSSANFDTLARAWGKVGGMDRMATLIKAIRAARGADRVLLLDGGDTLQGSFTALQSRGGDMIQVMEALGVEATTGHWEFTLGAARVTELFGGIERPGISQIPFLANNVVETQFEEPVFQPWRMFVKGGVRVAVIGQAFPYTPIANPRWMIPRWSMGIRESAIRRSVAAVRQRGAQVVVLLSHNGFDVDRKLASRVPGIDVILTAHTHDALPVPIQVGRTLLIASGSHTKFLTRLDLEVSGGRVVGYRHALIPVLADVITPDAEMRAIIDAIRAPHEAMLSTELARTETLLYRRDNISGTWDDLIVAAMIEEREAEIAFSPGFRWGAALMPGQAVTWDDVYNATAITYPACYRVEMSGSQIHAILEDVADNLFNPDPYYQQGGDLVRVGGLRAKLDPAAAMGRRVSDLVHTRSGMPIEPAKRYVVAGWGSVAQAVQGPPIWDVIGRYLSRHRQLVIKPKDALQVTMGPTQKL